MAEKYRTKILDVTIIDREASLWEWQVCSGDELIISGFEATRVEARFAGYDAMFVILASGFSQ